MQSIFDRARTEQMDLYLAMVAMGYALLLLIGTYVTRSVLFFLVARNALNSGAHPPANKQVVVGDKSTGGSMIALVGSHNADLPCGHSSRSAKRTEEFGDKSGVDASRPFISILVATYNEQAVINHLLESCNKLTYDKNKFEIIVIDDSNDLTYSILKSWAKKIVNLKVIHRRSRTGWKGGALNKGLLATNPHTDYALIIDADAVLYPHTLENFISRFHRLALDGNDCEVIQGYAVSGNSVDSDAKRCNWVAKAIDFRLLRRNMIEFVAKDKLGLPVQITGSLFMIRMDSLKALGFSEDLTEDWDLTIDLHLRRGGSGPKKSGSASSHHRSLPIENKTSSRKICYDPFISADCCSINKIVEYFNQRKRVSEGHTRSFRRQVLSIVKSSMKIRDKMEFLLLGLQYSKSLAVLALVAINILLLMADGNYFPGRDPNIQRLVIIEAGLLLVTGGINFASIRSRCIDKKYGIRDLPSLFVLELLILPALGIGSVAGFVRGTGSFYKTEKTM